MVFIFETAILVFTNILIRGGKRFTLEPDLEIETNWSLWEKLGGKWSAVFLFRQKMTHLPVSNGIECFDFASVKGKQCPKLPMGIKKVQPLANTVPLCPPGKQWKLIWNFLICCQTNFGQNKCRAIVTSRWFLITWEWLSRGYFYFTSAVNIVYYFKTYVLLFKILERCSWI